MSRLRTPASGKAARFLTSVLFLGKDANEEHCSMSKHTEAAKSFLTMAGTGQVQEAYDRYIAPTFIHHNQYFKGDRESLLTAMREAAETTPNKSVDVKHVYEDGDTVITHSLVTRRDPDAPGIAVVHIFRFERGRVVELWDVGQPIVKDSPNEYGMF